MRYKLSKFSKVINYKGNVLIYNTFSGRKSHVYDKEIIEQLDKLQSNTYLEENLINEYLRENYCCKEDIDEVENVKNCLKAKINNKEELNLIVIPTLQCNFNCIYCYENKESGYMTDETLNELYNAIIDYNNKYNLKIIRIDWFGGEPLLFLNKIKYIMMKINKFCDENNILYYHSMTTNGYLLNEEVFTELNKLKIRKFQITLDGLQETHDLHRKHVSKKDSWDIITNNLIKISKTSLDFNILIRVNYNYDIINNIAEFLDFIEDIFKCDNRFNLIFKQIGKWGGENDSNFEIIPYEYNNYVYLELLNLLKDKNINSSRLYSFNFSSDLCYANLSYSMVVHKDGTLGKCTLCTNHEDITKEPHFIGSIKNGKFEIIEENLNRWTNIPENLFEENGCYDCIAFPICLGTSCPLTRLREDSSFVLNCTPTKDYLDDLVIYDFEYNKRINSNE